MKSSGHLALELCRCAGKDFKVSCVLFTSGVRYLCVDPFGPRVPNAVSRKTGVRFSVG